METRRVEEKPMRKKEEEERWRQLFPDIKKCAIVIHRQKFDRLGVLKLKQDKGGGGRRSGDPVPGCDWMEPLEWDNICSSSRLRRFVKKVEVKVQENNAPANGSRRPRGGARGSNVLRLSADVITAGPAHRLLCRRESWRTGNECSKSKEDENDDHNYSLSTRGPDTPDGNNQSPQARWEREEPNKFCIQNCTWIQVNSK